MGRMEEASRKRTRKNQLQKMILETIKFAGIISIAAVAPNVIGAMGKLGMLPSARQKDVVMRSSDKLVRSGLIQWRDSKLRLTAKGEKTLRLLTLREFSKSPQRWDHKWRVLIFDIPEHRKALRLKIRTMLRAIGFVRLQDSVWVYPYDCEDLIALLKADFHIGDDMLYMIVDTIERDKDLIRFFKLN